ncbi:MAG: hypothetical protein AUI33_17240 [Ignavibacteria bacterium 13_1_40CM_2_61_4]|nr:MAG: hypothetical protein AUI33_17240 [Ignavibacteria bacterium 13_1_40CM_2_61_4]
MSAVVNSAADDSLAYPWDDPNTPDVDESMDGICEDAAHRCTLRAALDEAAIIGIPANVTFSIIRTTITIDPLQGPFSPPKGSRILGPDRKVGIRGSGLNSFLMILDSNTTVQGLEFQNATEGIDVVGSGNIIGGTTPAQANDFRFFSQNAINLIGDSNGVTGNFIGLSESNLPGGNQFGVFVIGSRNKIGGALPGQRNVISGNFVAGVAIAADTTNGKGGRNNVVGNYIGTDTGGTQKIPNLNGIEILVGFNDTIGGSTPADRNLISGNDNSGILIGIEAHDVTIQGNYIGTDVSGTSGLGNRDGVTLGPGSRNCRVDSNLISSNTGNGIVITGIADPTTPLPSTAHLVSGNEITLNGRAGVELFGDARSNVIGSSLTDDFEPNQIQRNALYGVSVLASTQGQGAPKENTFRKNVWLDNGTKGIQIDSAQDTIKAPIILSYYEVIGTTQAIVTGTHQRAGALIDVYTGEKQTSSHYEGRRWLGAGYVQGDHTFSITIALCGCHHLVATATDPVGNTSEFQFDEFPVTGVREEHERQPVKFSLGDAYPNPFNPNTTIRYDLPGISRVRLIVYNLLGQEAATLVSEEQPMGSYEVRWDAGKYSSGVYFYRLEAISPTSPYRGYVEVKKMVLAK